ncbi:hypothetical protein V1506DRAFT_549231 [Lipomyces tetrasporus]
MPYFPSLLSVIRSFCVFRKFLHTGLYSQLVAMEVPVIGETDDEETIFDIYWFQIVLQRTVSLNHIDPYGRPSLDIHLWQIPSHSGWKGTGFHGGRCGDYSCRNTPSVSQH